jgi:uncharacterized repeat protein (TIGR01451 family)
LRKSRTDQNIFYRNPLVTIIKVKGNNRYFHCKFNRLVSHTIVIAVAVFTLHQGVGRAQAQDRPISATGVQQAARVGKPKEIALKSAGSTRLDLRNIKRQKPRKRVRPEMDPPPLNPIELPGGLIPEAGLQSLAVPGPSAPAPLPLVDFAGLDLATWGSGWPPDTVGDVGPTHYIQSVNSAVGIYNKSTGLRVAAFTLDTFFALGSYDNLCDTDNFGDPVILYDSFEDRWVISDFAFQLDNSDSVVNPPGSYECIAVSKTGDPVAGGWNFYFLNFTDGLNDYPKLGVWPDGIYMSANMFDFSSGDYQLSRVWALNKEQMYAGESSIQVVEFEAPTSEFTLMPSNARLQTGTPPAGAPNYFSTIWLYSNAISFYKFHVDWDSISLSTFTGPFISLAPASWSSPPDKVSAKDGADIDTLAIRLMMQNQYSNIAGVESLWNSHTVEGGAVGTAAPRYYQVVVTGDNIAANTTQAATHTPDTTVDRFMPSLAVNREGDMAIGYSAASSTLFPAIRYAGRLFSDAVNTLPQTESSLIEGTGAQNSFDRWGDYSAMSLDPDGCTFWYTTEYYTVTSNDWQTRIGSFQLPDCTTVSSGTVKGTVTATTGGAAISDATVSLGSRTTTTDGSGFYQFAAIPSGTYPELAVTAPGYDPDSSGTVVVSDSGSTTLDFSLDNALVSACPIDTSQADFQFGIPVDVDLTTSAGDVTLDSVAVVDQQNTSFSNRGFGFSSTSWAGQTFTASVSGQLTAVDIYLFCSSCSGTTPDLTVSIQATSGDLPIGPDLATGTIAGFATGAGSYYKTTFTSPLSITSGTQYAIVVRADSDPSDGTYAYVVSKNGNTYSDGRRVTSDDSGSSWSGQNTDLGFHVYVQSGFVSSGNLISSIKDSNPATDGTTVWSTLSWNGSMPTDTSLRFQVAGSNSASGPFNFVGPDGTTGTYYTSSGGSLSQFDSNRYLKYQAEFSTTDSAATPTLNDVTTCYNTASISADLSISKTDGVTVATPGESVIYTIVASNTGPDAASGAMVSDTFPASLGCSWTCTGANGGTCAASGSGDISDTADLPVGGTATYTASCDIAADTSGSLANTATISFAGDDNVNNNSDTDTDSLTASADLAISKNDGVTFATLGTSVNYTIIASNAGPSDASGATVTDIFPGVLGCNWTCAGANGGTCAASGSGDISDTVNLPVGGTVTYSATCDIASDASGSLANTATVSFTGDSNSGNNSATDTDTLRGIDVFGDGFENQ